MQNTQWAAMHIVNSMPFLSPARNQDLSDSQRHWGIMSYNSIFNLAMLLATDVNSEITFELIHTIGVNMYYYVKMDQPHKGAIIIRSAQPYNYQNNPCEFVEVVVIKKKDSSYWNANNLKPYIENSPYLTATPRF